MRCPYYKRGIKGKKYAGINCSAINYNLGFSNNPEKYYLGEDTFNSFVVSGDFIEQRDLYVQRFCHYCYKQCKYYKE